MRILLACLKQPDLNTFAALIDSEGLTCLAACISQPEHSTYMTAFSSLLDGWIEHHASVQKTQTAVEVMGYGRLEKPDGRVWTKCGDDFMRAHLCAPASSNDVLSVVMCVLAHDTPQHFTTLLQWPEFWKRFGSWNIKHQYTGFFGPLTDPTKYDFLQAFLKQMDHQWSGLFWRTLTSDLPEEQFLSTLLHPSVQHMMAQDDFWTTLVDSHSVCLEPARLDRVWGNASATDQNSLMGALVWRQMGANVLKPPNMTELKETVNRYTPQCMGRALARGLRCCADELRTYNYTTAEGVKYVIQEVWLKYLNALNSEQLSVFLAERDLPSWNLIGLNDSSGATALILHAQIDTTHQSSTRKM